MAQVSTRGVVKREVGLVGVLTVPGVAGAVVMTRGGVESWAGRGGSGSG